MADTLADTCDTLGNVKTEALKNSLLYAPPEEKAETLGDTMGDLKAKQLNGTLPDNLRQAKANINLDTRQYDERGTGRHDG